MTKTRTPAQGSICNVLAVVDDMVAQIWVMFAKEVSNTLLCFSVAAAFILAAPLSSTAKKSQSWW